MKSYKEIAENILKQRDAYLVRQKRKKRLLAAVLPTVGCVAVLAFCLGLWGSGALDTHLPIADPSGEVTTTTQSVGTVHSTTTAPTSSQHTTAHPVTAVTTTTERSTATTVPTTVTQSTTTQPTTTQSTTTQPTTTTTKNEEPFVIDSIDKVNFYSAKKILNQDLLPFRTSGNTPPVSRMGAYVEYPIDRKKAFTISMVTYFLIELHDERGFLAQKLGGIGEVEVVVIQNDLDDLGRMITFKRGDVYYTCLANGGGTEDNGIERCDFSSHKYIDGFNLVKNLEQENYRFTVRYEGSKVVGFACSPFSSTPSAYVVDEVTFVEDYCAVIFTKRYFTIDMLEAFFGGTRAEEAL